MRSMTSCIAVACFGIAASAGDASVSESFHIDAPHDAVVDWLEAHQTACREAMNVRLVSEEDGVLTLHRENRRGSWTWKQRDSITKASGRWSLSSRLIEGLEGGIEEFASDVAITADGRRTLVAASTRVRVSGVGDKELRIDLHGRGRRLEELLKRELSR